MKNDQWKEDMRGGILAANTKGKVTLSQAQLLHHSIDTPIDLDLMRRDTEARTNSRCPTLHSDPAGREFGALINSFHRLNQGRDGG